jgi:hypothetical protein
LSVGNVTITGPPEVVKAIKDHTYNPTPTAVLKITPDDVFRQEPKTLRYDLPPGVHVSPTDAERKIEFKLTPRKDGATPG